MPDDKYHTIITFNSVSIEIFQAGLSTDKVCWLMNIIFSDWQDILSQCEYQAKGAR